MLLLLSVSLYVSALAGSLKSAFFSLVKTDHRLKEAVLQELHVQSEVECFQQCFEHNKCKSVNIFNELNTMNISSSTKATMNGLFYLKHYGGKWVKLDQSSGKFILSKSNPEYFSFTASSSLLHIESGRCMEPVSAVTDSLIRQAENCDGDNTVFQPNKHNSLIHVKTGSCINPMSVSSFPEEGTNIVIYPRCGLKRFQFFVQQANFITCQLLANVKKERSKNDFLFVKNWNYYELA